MTKSKASKPSLGQNFLTDDAAIQRIVQSLGGLRDRMVIEIGPGRGAITNLLASLLAPGTGTLVAIELDRKLAPMLASRYADRANVTVLQQDILQSDLSQIVREQGREKATVVGNLPYYITSDILLHLMAHCAVIDSAVVMMQREVAERIAATPGHREYGMLSASVQMMAQVENLFTLPPESFSPPPNVFSSVVRITMRPRYDQLAVERTGFERFLRTAFAQKRKTLAKNLRTGGYESLPITAAMAGVASDVRAEACTLEQMAAIYRALR